MCLIIQTSMLVGEFNLLKKRSKRISNTERQRVRQQRQRHHHQQQHQQWRDSFHAMDRSRMYSLVVGATYCLCFVVVVAVLFDEKKKLMKILVIESSLNYFSLIYFPCTHLFGFFLLCVFFLFLRPFLGPLCVHDFTEFALRNANNFGC